MKKLLILVIALVMPSMVSALVFSDSFDHVMDADWNRIDYQAWYLQSQSIATPQGPRVIGSWDGYMSQPDVDTGISQTILADNYVNTLGTTLDGAGVSAWTPGTTGPVLNGVLRMVSSNGGWSGSRNTGPFLYKNVTGNFTAEVQVVSADFWWDNLGGLMARNANTDNGENWVCLDYFPDYSVGNHSRNTVNGVSSEVGISGYPANTYLQLSRVGSTFYLKTSADGLTWTSLTGLEAGITRADIGDVQVGIFQSNFNADWTGTMEFDNFSITPEPATICLLGLGALALIRKKS